MAIDPNILTPKKAFNKEVSSIIKRVKSARKQKGVTEILVPGERGNRFYNSVMKSGKIEIEDNLYKELQKVNE